MSHDNLEDFNKEGILTNLLALEEHIVGNNGIKINSWCQRKHYLLGSGHHAFELQQLLSSNEPELSKRIGEFRQKWSSLMQKSPSAAEVRELRNEFREIIGDETLGQSQSQCGVCALDRRNSSALADLTSSPSKFSTEILPSTLVMRDVSSARKEKNGFDGLKLLLILGLIFAIKVGFLIAAKRRREQTARTKSTQRLISVAR